MDSLVRMTDEVFYEVPDALLAEFGLQPYRATVPSYRCDDPAAVLVPIGELIPPILGPGRRGLAPERLRWVLKSIATGQPLDAIPVFREDGAICATILNGAHRYYVSVKCGFSSMPCKEQSREDAELLFVYPDGQR